MAQGFRPFSIKFSISILVWAVLATLIIYLRETFRGNILSFLELLIWQIAIWVPWSIAPKAFELFLEVIVNLPKLRRWGLTAFFMLAIVSAHYLWFSSISTLYSPLNGLANVSYGVYAYFYIFWILIDIIIVTGVMERVGLLALMRAEDKVNILSKIKVQKNGLTRLLDQEDIIWISAEDYYAKLHTEFGFFLVRQSLKSLLKQLNQNVFVQTHRSAIVNINYIGELHTGTDGSRTISLKNGSHCPVSRRGLRHLKKHLAS